MKVKFFSQASYDAWLATDPDFSKITDFAACNLPGVVSLPELAACTYFVADNRLKKLRA